MIMDSTPVSKIPSEEKLLNILNRASIRYAEVINCAKNRDYFAADTVNRSLLELLIDFLYLALNKSGEEFELANAKHFYNVINLTNTCIGYLEEFPEINIVGKDRKWFEDWRVEAEKELNKIIKPLGLERKQLKGKYKQTIESKAKFLDKNGALKKITNDKYLMTSWYLQVYKQISYIVHNESQSTSKDYKKDIFNRGLIRVTTQKYDPIEESKSLETAVVLINILFQKAFEIKLLKKPIGWSQIAAFKYLSHKK